MDPITLTQISTAFRQILLFAGGFAVAKGWLSDDQLATVVPAVVTLGIAAYGIWKRRTAGLVKSAARAIDGTGAIIVPQAMADKLPGNVVGSVEAASRVPGITQN
jgi:O-antigen/teichoic acid export membrane protein